MSDLLIVDDEKFIRDLLLEHLSAKHSCVAAENAEEAMAVLAANSFKVVLTDIWMPGVSGLDLLDHVNARYPALVVIIISTDLEGSRIAVRRGAFDYVTKPFDLSHVGEAVNRALRHWKGNVSKADSPK